MIPTRRILLSSACYPYLGFAENKLAELDRLRRSIDTPLLKKCFIVQGIYILLTASELGNKILMWGGTNIPHILLSSGSASWAYNYYTDKYKEVAAIFDGELAPTFNGRSQYGTVGQATYRDGKWSSGEVSGVGEYVGGVNGFETAIYSDGVTVSGQQDGEPFTLATGVHTDLSFADYYAFNLAVSPSDVEWNQLDTTALYRRFLSNSIGFEAYRWTPSFFFAEEMNGLYETGWHYGKFGGWSEGDNFTALDADPIAGRAQLLGFLEPRGKNLSSYSFGYCEALTEFNMGEVTDQDTGEIIPPETYLPTLPVLSFFLTNGAQSDDGEAWFNWRSTVLLSEAAMRGGTKPVGLDRAFALYDPFGDGSLPSKVHLWGFEGWYNAGDLSDPTPDTVGIAIIQNQTASFYRFKGYPQLVFSTTQYHSHSLSPDGTILAVFESEDSQVINNITVFDLYGAKEKPNENYTLKERNPSLYVSGGFTLVRSSIPPVEVAATTACVIPHRLDGFEPETNIDAAVSPAVPPSGIYYPAMGSLHWQRNGQAALTINKMVVTAGVYGVAGQSVDACFDSTIIIDDPANPPASDRFITSWGPSDSPLDLYNGYIRGSFVGSHPDMRFVGAGNGDINTVTLPEHFSFNRNELGGGYSVDGAVGGYTIEEFPAPSQGCVDITYTEAEATDGCGRTEILEAVVEGVSTPPEIYNPVNGTLVITGSLIMITGGLPPYSVSISKGTVEKINDTTWEITLPECELSGQLAVGTITVLDACLQEDEIQVFLGIPGASWVLVDSGVPSPTNDCAATPDECAPNVPEGIAVWTAIVGEGGNLIKYEESVSCWCYCSGDTPPHAVTCTTYPLTGASCASSVCGFEGTCQACVTGRITYHWLCP